MGCSNSKTKKKPVEEPKPKPQPKPQPKTPRQPTPVPEPTAKELCDKRIESIQKARSSPYRYNRCTIEGGDVRSCFEEGLVFRIIEGENWYFYNDTLDCEAHIDYRFGPGSDITAGDRTTLEPTEDGWTCAHAVVYPLQTAHYISGTPNGYKSSVVLKPLSDAYRQEMCREANETVERELQAVRSLVGSESDDEVVLRRCAESHTPYVDVNFVPDQHMISRPIDKHQIPAMAMKRPPQYVEPALRDQTDAVLGSVVPHSIDAGHLGDCWLSCAAAVLAENEDGVKAMFGTTKPSEREVGAYRVALSKNGWWRSVIVDNYIPTVNDMPVFSRIADDPRELWVSLLQKAYAKVHGSYACVTGGDALHALQDFTGAPTYRFDKEWEDAAMNVEKAAAFGQKLVHYCEAGYVLVLSTPGYTSTTYLGSKREKDLAAFESRYRSIGLRHSYTYYIERIVLVSVEGRQVLLFKVHNPWNVKATWNGAWSAGSTEWSLNPAAAKECQPQSGVADGSFWMSWEDAINYFDGGGVAFAARDTVDYRVQGTFTDVQPSVVLEVNAAAPTTVTLMLCQQDKRGVSLNAPGARFAPVMLSVAKHDGTKQRVETNTSWDAEHPAPEYNFVVAREVAMRYTFVPGEGPYTVVPRIHRKGIEDGFDRPYVLVVIADEPLEGKLNIELKRIDSENRVFKNIITFCADDAEPVQATIQTHRMGQDPTIRAGSTVTEAAGARPAKAVKPVEDATPASDHAERESLPDDEAAATVAAEVTVVPAPSAADADAVAPPTPIADDAPAGRHSDGDSEAAR